MMDEHDRASNRAFWWSFGAGWAAFFLLEVVVGYEVRPDGFTSSVSGACLHVMPLVLLSGIVAANRRRLLRPEWSTWKTLGVHKVVGIVFALVAGSAAFAVATIRGSWLEEMAAWSTAVRIGYFSLQSLVLYFVFFCFLVWSESVRRVQVSHRTAAREAVLRAEAEAKAVRAQFNPHFVFNTLHSLMLLVRADPATAERAIEDVATLIRYASILQRADIDSLPLAKELEVARRYVALESLRLENRLHVDWMIDVDPGEVTIPAFALQTLIENAIKHGIEPSAEGGRVQVAVREEAGDLIVTVQDDGAGSAPSMVEARPGHGLGLLRQRLDARYGTQSSLDWTTAPGSGFEARVRLPVEAPAAQPELDVIEERLPVPSRSVG